MISFACVVSCPSDVVVGGRSPCDQLAYMVGICWKFRSVFSWWAPRGRELYIFGMCGMSNVRAWSTTALGIDLFHVYRTHTLFVVGGRGHSSPGNKCPRCLLDIDEDVSECQDMVFRKWAEPGSRGVGLG